MKKKLVCLACAAIAAVTAVSFVGCAGNSVNKSDIDELKQMIEELRGEVIRSTYKGQFYSLEYAYENGFILESQIQCVSYLAHGHVYEVAPDEEDWQNSENWTEKALSYVPESTLSEEAELYIKSVYYYSDFMFMENGAKIDDLRLEYFGRYNGKYYVVTLDSDLWGYPAVINLERYGNTVISSSGPYFTVFVYE